jgi:hypothetical protein
LLRETFNIEYKNYSLRLRAFAVNSVPAIIAQRTSSGLQLEAKSLQLKKIRLSSIEIKLAARNSQLATGVK